MCGKYIPVVPAQGRLKQEDCEFEASLGSIERYYLKTNKEVNKVVLSSCMEHMLQYDLECSRNIWGNGVRFKTWSQEREKVWIYKTFLSNHDWGTGIRIVFWAQINIKLNKIFRWTISNDGLTPSTMILRTFWVLRMEQTWCNLALAGANYSQASLDPQGPRWWDGIHGPTQHLVAPGGWVHGWWRNEERRAMIHAEWRM